MMAAEYLVCLATFASIQAWGVEKGMLAGLVLAAVSFTVTYAQASGCWVVTTRREAGGQAGRRSGREGGTAEWQIKARMQLRYLEYHAIGAVQTGGRSDGLRGQRNAGTKHAQAHRAR